MESQRKEDEDSQRDQPWVKQHRVELSQHSDQHNDECGLRGRAKVPAGFHVLGLCPLPAQKVQSGLQGGVMSPHPKNEHKSDNLG